MNLLVMREDGDIDKDCFRERKKELDSLIENLQNEIENLSPKPIVQKKMDYQSLLADLKKRLESYVECNEVIIQESVIEAFIEKIWVSKDEFRWYLRCDQQCENESGLQERIKIAEFTIVFPLRKGYTIGKT